MKKLPLVTLAVVALAACTSAPDLGTSAAAIQGGSPATTETFAVGVFDDTSTTCSGTLIAPNLVLTARHCISNDSGGSVVDCTADEFTTVSSPSLFRVTTASTNAFDAAAHAVAKILVPKSTAFCGNDIALLILDEAIPEKEAKPARPALDPKTAAYGATITAIGYGTTEPGGGDDGSRRRLGGIPILCLPGDGSGCDPADHDMTAAEIAVGNGLCEGDSGSGAFVTSTLASGSPLVVGVLSRAGDDGGECTDGIYTRTDAFADFLVAGALEAAKAGGYDPPAWAGPASQDAGAAPSSPEDPRATEPDAAPPVEDEPAPPAAADGGCNVASHASHGSFAWMFAGLAALRRRRRH